MNLNWNLKNERSAPFAALLIGLSASLIPGSVVFGKEVKDESLVEFLGRFEADAYTTSREKIEKSVKQIPKLREKSPNKFSQSEIDDLSFVEKKDKERTKVCKTASGDVCPPNKGRVPVDRNDKFNSLVDNAFNGCKISGSQATCPKLVSSLSEIPQALQAGKVHTQPWSDDYWAIYKGILGTRYADKKFPLNSQNWAEISDYAQKKNSIDKIVMDMISNTPNSSSIDTLSPSEKWDLLIGNVGTPTFTDSMWREGRSYHERDGKVETWMGICHGWAPAAYLLPRAQKPVTLLAVDGKTKIKFYPADIHALGSLLWARGDSNPRFVGGRCNTKDPATDLRSGHVLERPCFDTNPATWHLTAVNQIGLVKRPFVFDVTFDYEVWNQPVVAYKYKYFNPLTKKVYDTFEPAAIAKLKDPAFKAADKFAAYRTEPEATGVIGVSMDVDYMVEVRPRHAETNTPKEHDAISSVKYVYDLAIDDKGTVITGEWYQKDHPDFLWSPAQGAVVQTPQDAQATGNWAGGSTGLPKTWAEAAKSAAARGGLPLSKLVTMLFTLSQIQGSR